MFVCRLLGWGSRRREIADLTDIASYAGLTVVETIASQDSPSGIVVLCAEKLNERLFAQVFSDLITELLSKSAQGVLMEFGMLSLNRLWFCQSCPFARMGFYSQIF